MGGVAGDQARIPGGQASRRGSGEHQEAEQGCGEGSEAGSVQAFGDTVWNSFIGTIRRRGTVSYHNHRRKDAWHDQEQGSICGTVSERAGIDCVKCLLPCDRFATSCRVTWLRSMEIVDPCFQMLIIIV
jgi:hypothetical protein